MKNDLQNKETPSMSYMLSATELMDIYHVQCRCVYLALQTVRGCFGLTENSDGSWTIDKFCVDLIREPMERAAKAQKEWRSR